MGAPEQARNNRNGLDFGKERSEITDLNNGHRSNMSSICCMFPFIGHMQCFQPASASQSAIDEMSKMEKEKEENSGAKKLEKGGWKSIPYIMGNELCAIVAVSGLSANIVVYLTTQFNIKNIAATHIINISTGGMNLSPLIGAIIADSYLGRFWTIGIGSIMKFSGVALLMLTAIIPSLRPPPCDPAKDAYVESCQGPSKGQLAVLYTYFALATIATAGTRSNSGAFGADQFEDDTAKGTKQLQSFFNWYYTVLNISVIMATTVIVYVQDSISWSWGFGICAMLTGIALIVFFAGTRLYYIRAKPRGSPFTGFAQVIVASIRKRSIQLPSNAQDLYGFPNSKGAVIKSCLPLTQQLRFLNKAAVKTEGDYDSNGLVMNPWRLCSVQQIEELKLIIKTLPIWSSAFILNVMFSQLSTFTILQALTMDRHVGPHLVVPAGSMNVFTLLASAAWLPIYDKLIVPFTRRLTKNGRGITKLQRIGIGHDINILALGVAALVEMKRRNAAEIHGLIDKPRGIIPMSAFWLVAQNVLAGLGEAFHTVGQFDFFYDQFPHTVRSTGVSLLFAGMGVGYYLSSLLVSVVHRSKSINWLPDNMNRGHLDYFYFLLSGMGIVNLVYFVMCSRWYQYKADVNNTGSMSTV